MNAFKMTALTLALAVTAGAAQAEDIITIPDVTVSGSAAMTTDYLFRGISQSSNNAAVQASMTASHKSGIYGTLWGSSIANGNGGSEIDVMLGYAMPINLGPELKGTLDVGVMRYVYPGANKDNLGSNGLPIAFDPDYNEIYASVALPSVVMEGDTLKTGLAFSNDYFLESDQFMYVYGSYSTPIPSTNFGLVTSVGYNRFDDNFKMAQALGTDPNAGDDYIDYKIGTTFGVQGVAAELAYAGTDLKKSECGGDLCEGRVVLTLSKAF